MRLALCLLLIGALSSAVPCLAEGEAPQPYQLIRALQSLQNDAAAGRAEARAAQSRLVGEIAIAFRKTAPDLWRERRNVRAAALFLLSGGPATSVRGVLGASVVPPSERPLIKGALAYAEGREAEAKQLLLPIDALSGAEGIGGPLALVQAALVMHEEPKRALLLLDRARLLSPGTLIEEAALRRAVFIADETDDAAAFARFAHLYKRRFPSSVYAGAVEKRLAPAALRSAGFGGPFSEDLLSLLDGEARLDLRLSIARAALVKADLNRAGAQAALAARDAKAGSAGAARAALYSAMSRLLVPHETSALQSIDRAGLSPQDVDLLDAGTLVAERIRAAPLAMEVMAEDPQVETGVIKDAILAIRAVDAILGEAR